MQSFGKKHKYSHIIWDWNGTLLDDAEWCLEVINRQLKTHGLTPLSGIDEYRKVFCFPIIKYYENIGFNFSEKPFEELAEDFNDLYRADNTGNCGLHQNTMDVLSAIRREGMAQVILSASERSFLMSQIGVFGITDVFEEILGISDIYAASKVDIGLDYIQRTDINSAVLIGDTTHDCDVAKALGVDCILIPNGHQSRETLLMCGVTVLDGIIDVLDYLSLV